MGLLSDLRDGIQSAGRDLDELRDRAANTTDSDAYDALLDDIAARQSALAQANEAFEESAHASLSGVKDLLGGMVTEVQETILITEEMFENWRRSGSIAGVSQAMLDMQLEGEQALAELAQGAAVLAEQVRHIPALVKDGILNLDDLAQNTDSYITNYIDPMIDRTGELRRQLQANLDQARQVEIQINSTVAALRGADTLQEKIKGAMDVLADGSTIFTQRLAAGLRDLESGKISADQMLKLVEQVQQSLGGLKTSGDTAFDNIAELLKEIARQAEREDYDASARGGIY